MAGRSVKVGTPRKAVWKRYSKGGEVRFVRKNNLEDVFDTARFKRHPKYRPWRCLGEVLGERHEHQAKRKAIKLFRRMLEMIVEDMLERNVFILPRQNFGYWKIGDLRKHKELVGVDYEIKYDGVVYGGLCILDHLVKATIGGHEYNLCLTRANIKKLRDLRDQGRRY